MTPDDDTDGCGRRAGNNALCVSQQQLPLQEQPRGIKLAPASLSKLYGVRCKIRLLAPENIACWLDVLLTVLVVG